MSQTYKKEEFRSYKIRQNKILAKTFQQYMRDNHITFKNATALIIDTSDALTTDALLKIGMLPENIWVVNDSEGELILLKWKHPNINIIPADFDQIIQTFDPFVKFNLVYYDSCNTLKTSYTALYNLYNKGYMAKKHFLAVTMSSRDNTDLCQLPPPYRIMGWSDFDTIKPDNLRAYYTDMLIKDYARRNGFCLERLVEWSSQYKAGMYQLLYEASNDRGCFEGEFKDACS